MKKNESILYGPAFLNNCQSRSRKTMRECVSPPIFEVSEESDKIKKRKRKKCGVVQRSEEDSVSSESIQSHRQKNTFLGFSMQLIVIMRMMIVKRERERRVMRDYVRYDPSRGI